MGLSSGRSPEVPLTCPRGGGQGTERAPIAVHGVLTEEDGRPIAVDVYPGDTRDRRAVSDQVEKPQKRFGLPQVVLVGDRGVLTETQIEFLKERPCPGWISALRGRTEKNAHFSHFSFNLRPFS